MLALPTTHVGNTAPTPERAEQEGGTDDGAGRYR
jgi:hypothetical protein